MRENGFSLVELSTRASGRAGAERAVNQTFASGRAGAERAVNQTFASGRAGGCALRRAHQTHYAERAVNQGFSLVELSIVLVILGLLTGGILAGQNLIRAAELRSINTQIQNFQSATYTFRDKYFQLPGDFDQAEDFWGTATNCPGTNAQPSTGLPTCNGDNDGILETNSGNAQERFRYWHHLANAGLLEGSYTGVTGPGGADHAVFGENVPRGRISNTGWAIVNWDNSGGGNNFHFAYDFKNHYVFGGQHASSAPAEQVLVPEEAWNVDTKIDDGKPGTGRVVGNVNNCSLAANNTDYTAGYDLQRAAPGCMMRFLNMY